MTRRCTSQGGPHRGRLVALVAFLALLPSSHEKSSPAIQPSNEQSGSATIVRGQGFSMPSGSLLLRDWSWRSALKNSVEVVRTGLQTKRPDDDDRQIPQDFSTLVEETILGLDVEALVQKLNSEAWSSETFLLKSLLQSGASNMAVWKGSDAVHHVSFGMDIGIPWKHVRIVDAWREDQSREELPEGQDEFLVRGTFSTSAGEDWQQIEIGFSVDQPILRRLLPRLQLQLRRVQVPGQGEATKVWIGGLVQWKESCHLLIRKPMDRGFIFGLGTYGRAIVHELRQLASSKMMTAELQPAL